MNKGSGGFEGTHSHATCFANGPGTNPEESISETYVECFSIVTLLILSKMGKSPCGSLRPLMSN
jgi:organic hydroperoxide reductase OsmC/OhrA